MLGAVLNVQPSENDRLTGPRAAGLARAARAREEAQATAQGELVVAAVNGFAQIVLGAIKAALGGC
ncbi:MAG: hypothetical protein M0P31_18980 [Solirubrobacteraceae bacterium]|nr:hypothetical protein [Solirubrobacteraceae bacterium]